MLKKYEQELSEFNLEKDYSNLANVLNEMLYSESYRYSLWESSPYRGSAWTDVGGPMWADFQESCLSVLPGIKQFVGHTGLSEVKNIKRNNGDGEGEVTYCDILCETIDKKGKRRINTDCYVLEL